MERSTVTQTRSSESALSGAPESVTLESTRESVTRESTRESVTRESTPESVTLASTPAPTSAPASGSSPSSLAPQAARARDAKWRSTRTDVARAKENVRIRIVAHPSWHVGIAGKVGVSSVSNRRVAHSGIETTRSKQHNKKRLPGDGDRVWRTRRSDPGAMWLKGPGRKDRAKPENRDPRRSRTPAARGLL